MVYTRRTISGIPLLVYHINTLIQTIEIETLGKDEFDNLIGAVTAQSIPLRYHRPKL